MPDVAQLLSADAAPVAPDGPAAQDDPSANPRAHQLHPWRRRLRFIAWLGFVVVALTQRLDSSFIGICFIALVTALFFQRERSGLAALRALRDWAGFLTFLVLYVISRDLADTIGMPLQEDSMIAIDRVIGLGELPTHRLQALIDWTTPPPWWEVVYSVNYGLHFAVSISVMVTLYVRNRTRWQGFIRRWVLCSLLGLVGYVLLPTIPPWMSSELGTVAMVHEGLPRSWSVMTIPGLENVFQFGRDYANPVAAMPSLHAAYPALLFLFFAPSRDRVGKSLLAIYTLFMGWTIVITGQHWVIDVFAGWGVAWLSHRIVMWCELRFPPRTESP